ncbi:MAG: A/G-specific adenine glycosylase [Alphaproteobacteria bacterium]|nr:A/G-specific adenine glycosylase [Alphaproteobacteria bacterium]
MHEALLLWYDNHRRVLPWRAGPGQAPNPYHVYLSEVMLQQTTVATVKNYFLRFIAQWPTIHDLAEATLDDVLLNWQGLGYYSRAKNLKNTIDIMAQENHFPRTYQALLKYPGIGDYTAKAIAAICFDEPVIPIDGNVIRVFSRYFALHTPLPNLKKDILEHTHTLGAGERPGDFAQAIMDLGSMVCTPKNPQCHICPISHGCKSVGTATLPPFREPKTRRPTRFGYVYLVQDDGQILIEKRPQNGLLANLWGFPTSPWQDIDPDSVSQHTQDTPHIKHVFTHFTLYLAIRHIQIQPYEAFIKGDQQKFIDPCDLNHYAFPTLMQKVFQHIGAQRLQTT